MKIKKNWHLSDEVKKKKISDNNCVNGNVPTKDNLHEKASVDVSKSDAPETEKAPSVSYFALFRFASTKDKCCIFIAMMASVVSGCMSPLSTLLFAALLDAMVRYGKSITDGVPDDDKFLAAVRNFAIYDCLCGAVLVVGGYIATVLMNISAFNQVYRIRQEYLKAAMNQDFAYFDLRQTGDFATKMSDDVIKLEDGIGEKAATFVYYQTVFLSSIIMALVKGWKLALLCLITFPITLFLVGVSGLIASKLTKLETVVSGRAGSVAEEVLSSIRTVYAFSGQNKELERYQTHLNEAIKINVKKSFFNGLAMGLLYFCIFCAYALSFWFGTMLLISEPWNYDTETMIAVLFGVLMGSEQFGMSFMLVEAFGMACGAGAHIFKLIDNVPSINPLLDKGVTPNNCEGNIEFKDVQFHYPSRPDVPILKGVNLNVKNGQTVALVGQSGSGKSTIIQLVSRFYDVVEGQVTLDGHDVRELSVRWLRSQIGVVGQEPVLFNATIAENIRYGSDNATRTDIEAAARAANAHHFIKTLPKGYDTPVGERGAALSGGQKQRIAIARALVRDPRVLLLDEATSALDTASEAKVQAALDKARYGRTTIVVAHRLTTIRNADVIYVFNKGDIVEYGNHDTLMDMKGVYYDMVTLQDLPIGQESEGTKLIREVSVISDQVDDEVVPEILEEPAVEEVQKVSFWRVLRLNTPEWKLVTVASLCALAGGFAMPLFSVIFSDFIGALSSSDEDYIVNQTRTVAFVFVGIGILSGIFYFIQVFLYGLSGAHLTQRLRRLMLQNLLRQELSFFDDKSNSTGALCAKLSGEASHVQGATGQRIGTVFQAVGTFLCALVIALVYEWRVGLVALAFVPVMVAIVYKEGRMMSEESFGAAKTMQNSAKVAVEAVSNIRTVASLGREPLFLKEYVEQLRPALALAKRASHWRGIVFGLARGVFDFIYAAALFYGGQLIVYEGIGYDIVLKSAQALLMGAATAASAFAFAPNFQKGINAAGRIIVLINRKPNIVDPDEPIENFETTGEASLQSVQFSYPTRPTVEVLKGLDLDITKGQTVALVGASGCGKSTVIQLLQRYYDPYAGVVALDGVPLPQLLMVELRRSFGLVQQEPVLFDRTIGENIAYGDNERTPSAHEIIDAATQANIHNFVMSLPMGYDTNIGSKGTQLSGGQKQRVAIARALIRKPQILLLDEATSALDTESEKVVQAALDAAQAGRTCVTIAHRLSTIRDADVICVVHAGRIAERGTHQDLMNAKGLYYRLYKRTQS